MAVVCLPLALLGLAHPKEEMSQRPWHGTLGHDLLQLAAETWPKRSETSQHKPKRSKTSQKRSRHVETGRLSPVPSSDPPHPSPRNAPGKELWPQVISHRLIEAYQTLVQGVDQAPGGSDLERIRPQHLGPGPRDLRHEPSRLRAAHSHRKASTTDFAGRRRANPLLKQPTSQRSSARLIAMTAREPACRLDFIPRGIKEQAGQVRQVRFASQRSSVESHRPSNRSLIDFKALA